MKELSHPEREAITLSGVLYALSDPVRLKIAVDLARRQEKTCGSFDIGLTKSTMTHHFKTLRDAGVIHVRIDGTQRIISLRTGDLNARFPGLLKAILSGAER